MIDWLVIVRESLSHGLWESLYYFIFFNILQVPVPALKEQIASVTGVLSDQQRLICRGKVLKDDQLLSAYRILFSFMLLWLAEVFLALRSSVIFFVP